MDMKEGMAVSVVTQYPKFNDPHPKRRPWHRILHRPVPSGWIANCSINILRSFDFSDRPRGGGGGKNKRKGEEAEGETSDEEEVEDLKWKSAYFDKNASWISLQMPCPQNKNAILNGMKDSFEIRRKWIVNKGPSITEVLSRYPHLMSFGGEMLIQEFDLIHPNKGSLFLKNFPLLIERVVQLDNLQPLDNVAVPDSESDLLKACLFISYAMPPRNLVRYKRAKKNGVEENVISKVETLVHIIPLGCNIETIVREKREANRRPVQPYLCALMPADTITKQYIVGDNKFLEVVNTSLVFGLDMLFKAYHIFDADYPLGWQNFWELVEHGVSLLDPCDINSSAKEFLDTRTINFESDEFC